ncbi:uncharacterized protein LOC131300883 [Rhododendron vialii]|uniref:uncharacterized protein LOC131300883 n=1 Tax=Rhododendron vialii TaxID=182163 RepID=UPI00265F864F|nr:uncharacterized protein LOC131300883 [Rhododendron vialii]
MGPSDKANRYSGYLINGVKYHTQSRELRRKTQNSGIMVKANTCSYASAKDMNPVEGEVTYYGYVMDIVELYYSYDRRYVLFKCNWIDNNKGLKHDDFGFTLVNFKHLLYTKNQEQDEPFVLASQAQQIFYIQDLVDDDWNVVVKMKPRDLYEVCGEQPVGEATMEGFVHEDIHARLFFSEGDVNWVRQGLNGVIVDEATMDAELDADMES